MVMAWREVVLLFFGEAKVRGELFVRFGYNE